MEHEHAASLTARAVKKALPERAILTKDARQTLNSATSVFTLYLASIAHETSVANKRSTITLKDVLQTLRDADFEHFIEPIEECLQETKAAASRKKNQKVAAEEDGAETTNEVTEQLDEVAIDTNEEDADEDEGMMSVEEPSDVEETGGDEEEEEKGSVDETMQGESEAEQKGVDQMSRERKAEDEDEDEDSTEAMEQS